MRFTERTLRIFKYAEIEAKRTTNIIYPVHLVLGMLLERTGVCAELSIKNPELRELLVKRIKEVYSNTYEHGISYEPFKMNISLSTNQVLIHASNRMKRFNQIYLNEGHLSDAIFKSKDFSTYSILDGLDVSSILGIMSSPRDMAVPLKDYEFLSILTSNINYRKAEPNDAASLKVFVESEFGARWLDSIENGFLKDNIPIFIALDDNQIIGFACFDVVRKRKGLFGPMGTTLSNRVQGIGFILLHHCLREMQEIGYEYAIIGQAGPLEFYEKACNAVVIPRN
ncbi:MULTISPECIES: GNAT family N-acetyltransferase [Bacillaceae]|uniref:GNAT family N-acetyltransferase n=1 Tax=Bacillaceae TaxID=186817 RepID=UPI001584AD5A|nr:MULTISPECIES: GNAT family N-acetyltransferase [Bacillaceae]